MNVNKEERGVDKTVGNLLHAIPDAEEYQERLHTICDTLRDEIKQFIEVEREQAQRLKSMNVNLQLLADEIRRADDVVRSWRNDIQGGAADLGMLIPKLGFRVIKDLPGDVLA